MTARPSLLIAVSADRLGMAIAAALPRRRHDRRCRDACATVAELVGGPVRNECRRLVRAGLPGAAHMVYFVQGLFCAG